jgi:hypothetical protein
MSAEILLLSSLVHKKETKSLSSVRINQSKSDNLLGGEWRVFRIAWFLVEIFQSLT